MWWKNRSVKHDMIQQMTELTRALEDVSEKLKQGSVQVTVESLNVEEASLESLVFRLESLDIKELSGSLNLGNNFGQVPESVRKSTSSVRLSEASSNAPRSERLSGTVKTAPEKQAANLTAQNRDPQANRRAHQADGESRPSNTQLRQTSRGYAVRF